ESRVSQFLSSTFSVFIKPGLAKSNKVACEHRAGRQRIGATAKADQIRTTSALRFQRAARKQDIVQTSKQPIVIEDPMKGGGAHDDIESALQRKLEEIAGDKMQASTEISRQVLARAVQHILREIDADNASAG